MKKLCYSIVFVFIAWSLQACNNNRSQDSVSLADKANKEDDTVDFRPVPDLGVENIDTYSDADFAVKAADGGLLEVQLGKIALTNASTQGVKDFGQMMVDDHSKANKELMAIAEQKEIVLPSVPGDENVKHIKDLNEKKGNDFDKDYIDMMVDDHKEDIALFEMASTRALDVDIKAFANKTLPVLKKHLAAAESLKKTLDSK